MRSRVFRKAVVLLQIAAIVFLQLYALAPLFSKTFSAHAAAIRCVGDHKKCGCSPGRVTAQTCCCYQSGRLAGAAAVFAAADHPSETAAHDDAASNSHCGLSAPAAKTDLAAAEAEAADAASLNPGCCDPAYGNKGLAAPDGQGGSRPVISSSPCGGSPDYFFASLEKIKFLRQLIPANEPELSATVQHHHSNVFQGRIPEPPVPPPKVSLTA